MPPCEFTAAPEPCPCPRPLLTPLPPELDPPPSEPFIVTSLVVPGRQSAGTRPYVSRAFLSAPNNNSVLIASVLSAAPPAAAQCMAVHRSSSSLRKFGSAPICNTYNNTSNDPCEAATMHGVRLCLSKPFPPFLGSAYQSPMKSTGTFSRSNNHLTCARSFEAAAARTGDVLRDMSSLACVRTRAPRSFVSLSRARRVASRVDRAVDARTSHPSHTPRSLLPRLFSHRPSSRIHRASFVVSLARPRRLPLTSVSARDIRPIPASRR